MAHTLIPRVIAGVERNLEADNDQTLTIGYTAGVWGNPGDIFKRQLRTAIDPSSRNDHHNTYLRLSPAERIAFKGTHAAFMLERQYRTGADLLVVLGQKRSTPAVIESVLNDAVFAAKGLGLEWVDVRFFRRDNDALARIAAKKGIAYDEHDLDNTGNSGAICAYDDYACAATSVLGTYTLKIHAEIPERIDRPVIRLAMPTKEAA